MNKKLILTSIFAISVVGSAYAEPSNTVTGAPANGSYQADTTYTGAATAEELGVYEDNSTAIANANYEDILYNISAGNYLAAGSEGTGTICPANSYCPGLTDVTYSATNNQGINACPTDFSLSAEGTSDSGQCYQEATGTCSTADTPAHAASCTYTTGSKRYASAPTTLDGSIDITCVNGWHVKPGATLADDFANASKVNSQTSTYGYINNSGTFNEEKWNGTAKGQEYYGLTENNTWATSLDDYAFGMVSGKALCSTTSGSYAQTGTPDETGGGQYCWCQIDGYTPVNGTKQSLSSAWVFHNDYNDADNCASNCANGCALYVRISGEFRGALFGSLGASLPSCEANTINITWGDTDAADVSANNAGTATYGEDIRTPVKAQTKPGKRFTGWTFTKPTQE